MKKLLLSTALLSAVISTSAAKFECSYVKGDVVYSTTSMALKDVGAGSKKTAKLKGFGGVVTAGYGDNIGSVYLGGEAYLGKVFASKKLTLDETETGKFTRGLNAGVAGRVGGHVNDTTLAYFRLGLDYARYEFKVVAQEQSIKKNFTAWSVVPGIGIDMKVSQNVFVTAGVDYSIAFKASMPSPFKGALEYAKKPKSLTFRLGAGYQF